MPSAKIAADRQLRIAGAQCAAPASQWEPHCRPLAWPTVGSPQKVALGAARVPGVIDIQGRSTEFTEYAELGYYKHLNHPSRWRLRKGIEQALASAIQLGRPRLDPKTVFCFVVSSFERTRLKSSIPALRMS